ncbi:MAG: hypothetical protein NT003_01160 [Candidatus Magasanikbacteria bacterium]|nr:hypothetical protein [Candidatus Magasanikbacteria bacterium]
MSDLSIPSTIEQSISSASESMSGTSIAEVLLEQVDAKVAEIEAEQTRLKPYQTALATAQEDLKKVQDAAAVSKNPDVQKVYAEAIEVATKIVVLARQTGQEVVDKITKLQGELQALIAQLRAEDPENPLVKEL